MKFLWSKWSGGAAIVAWAAFAIVHEPGGKPFRYSLLVGAIIYLIFNGAMLYYLDKKRSELDLKLMPMPRPSYDPPKLFGVPMEWDPETGFWTTGYGCIEVDLMFEQALPGVAQALPGSFTWHIESWDSTGSGTLEEATLEIEVELTRIRNAIGVSKGWHMENA